MLIDGKALSKTIKAEIKTEVESWVAEGHRAPHLAAVLIGEDPASQVYVRNKVKSCEQVGFQSTLIKHGADISEKKLLEIVAELNRNSDIDGFIVQLPLPRHIDENKVTLAINPEKDVDGFHPVNFGRIALDLPAYIPATPYGILTMLERYKIETEGKHAVVLGRSHIVGTPISLLLSRKAYPGNCTVTVAHSRTKNTAELTRQADIIVAAIGQPGFLTGDMVKEGVVVIDVGINRVEDDSKKRGYRLQGDVDYDSVAPKAEYITPVPGGVGPMTVTSLILNTFRAAKGEVYG